MGDYRGRRCGTGCLILNTILGGGIHVRALTEFVSESSAGKTQLSIQISLQVHLPEDRGGLQGSCLYLYTDPPFPLRRLQQIASFTHLGDIGTDNVFVQHITDVDHLLQQLRRTEVVMNINPHNKPVRMIIIDSFGSLFRSQFENNLGSVRRRSCYYHRISLRLKNLATRYNMAVITTNHVKDYFGDNAGEQLELWSSNRHVVPALGPSWRRHLYCRLFLSRGWNVILDTETGEAKQRPTRSLDILFDPVLTHRSVYLVINETGIEGRVRLA